jgi:hypothetical protein
MSAQTPGPWRWMNDDTLVADYSRRTVVMTGGRAGTLQTCGTNGRLRQLRADEPNARLIAEAPNLLATLKDIHAHRACSCRLEPLVNGPVPCETCQIGNVIAKAEGRPAAAR